MSKQSIQISAVAVQAILAERGIENESLNELVKKVMILQQIMKK